MLSFRFVPVVETTIEQKHAKLTKSRRKHGPIGPVRASLSNRLPALQKSLLLDQMDMGILLECFSKCRKTFQLPALFGVQDHTLLNLTDAHGRLLPMATTDLHTHMSQILYHADLDSMFVETMDLQAHYKNHKRLGSLQVAQYVGRQHLGRISVPKTIDDVLLGLMEAHFSQQLGGSDHTPKLFSAKASTLKLLALETCVGHPAHSGHPGQ